MSTGWIVAVIGIYVVIVGFSLYIYKIQVKFRESIESYSVMLGICEKETYQYKKVIDVYRDNDIDKVLKDKDDVCNVFVRYIVEDIRLGEEAISVMGRELGELSDIERIILGNLVFKKYMDKYSSDVDNSP